MLSRARDLRLDPDGAELRPGALDTAGVGALADVLAKHSIGGAGTRLFGADALRPFLEPDGLVGAVAASAMDPRPRPVRALLLDKTPEANWAVAWHQDRTIAVRERLPAQGFGPWTRKHFALHVAPPFEVLAQMVTLRVHLDPVPRENGPLLVAPGSHRLGCVPQVDVDKVVADCGVAICLAQPGDIWVYRTPILHASERSACPTRRRVLQVDHAIGPLGQGLEWLGV